MKKILFLLMLTIILSACRTDNIEESALDLETNCSSLETDIEEELEKRVSLFKGDTYEPLKEKLNEDVLTSKENLEEELATVAYSTCIDVEESSIESYDKVYFSMLEYFHTYMMSNNKEALTIEEINHKGRAFTDYAINIVLDDGRQADIFRFDPFTYSGDVLSKLDDETVMESSEELYASEMKTDFIDRIFSGLENPLNAAFYNIPNILEEKDLEKWEPDLDKNADASKFWHLHAIIIDGDIKEQNLLSKKENWRDTKIYPSYRTYNMIERLEDVHDISSDIPYPKEALENEEWFKATDYMLENMEKTVKDGQFDEDLFDIYQYIHVGEGYLGELKL
ncbi:hypothetical protein [Oceanobacillus timonensis]|uniref:hypothetical protein n=1 Tax=Oceanobacillus timonensis TaxID=1926285 RepID=UPI0009BBC460|nr:hypothetical protein [Oceanobacillus timonensis]